MTNEIKLATTTLDAAVESLLSIEPTTVKECTNIAVISRKLEDVSSTFKEKAKQYINNNPQEDYINDEFKLKLRWSAAEKRIIEMSPQALELEQEIEELLVELQELKEQEADIKSEIKMLQNNINLLKERQINCSKTEVLPKKIISYTISKRDEDTSK